MHRLTIAALLFAALALSGSQAWAQGIGSGIPGGQPLRPNLRSRPKHKLHKNRAPVLSPSLNMLPEVSTTFEGQFLMRQLPQEQIYKNADQSRKVGEDLQNQIDQQENQIKSGIGKTGHRTQFMNYGGYYQFGRGGRRR